MVRCGDATYGYDAFGNKTGTSSSDNNSFRYCGEYTDSESGLVYLRARYYNSETGRFTIEEPAKDSVNWYTYCGNNPILARSVGNSLVSRDSWGAQDFYDDWVPDTYKHAIVIHHTANNKGVKQIEKEHIEQGYSGIGYHFIISKDGLIYIGRPLEVKGGHVEGFNSGRIGITLIGNFENEIPTAEQLTSMRNLTNVLKDLYGISNSSIVGHRDFNGQMATTITVCPGKNLYQYIRQYWPLWIGV